MTRRSIRDWIVDTTMFLLASLVGLLGATQWIDAGTLPDPAWLFHVDQVVGVLACASIWVRKRWPSELALILIALSTFSELSGGAMIVSLFTVAIHRPPRTSVAVFVLSMVSSVIFIWVRPDPGTQWGVSLALMLAIQGTAVGWGLFIHHRRQLVLSLKDKAARAETEAQLRAERAIHLAREEIAREMHDVLGHRLSLLSVHAGALEYNPDAPASDIARAAKVIRDSAHQALQDLREVIGVLRAPVGEMPQPTLADVTTLVAESRRAGMEIELRQELSGTTPDLLGRTGYRIVQEALTNARKHAPGAEVQVSLSGGPGDGLAVEVRNSAPSGPPVPGRTSGQGLIGLGERVALAEGRLEHGPTCDGWRLAAWLPWPM
ncbi:signal transduction histidine kinase [Kibdelosporangium banguiense]|uniref:histidine kinase n=1 Tax=Kibdelosporangium banguiense TaxID=1365924 RepID=A0ABS4TDL0_9PSEU|nr:histidine kinase [Kibdelosporangium banguiense]MBP2322512.1 signal transduction histidine kinase [Kibdelosporangium banguiense]